MKNGDIYVTGSGDYGQLGLDPINKGEELKDEKEGEKAKSTTKTLFYLENEIDGSKLLYSETPLYHYINMETKFKYISCAPYHIVAINIEGHAYAWGRNAEG